MKELQAVKDKVEHKVSLTDEQAVMVARNVLHAQGQDVKLADNITIAFRIASAVERKAAKRHVSESDIVKKNERGAYVFADKTIEISQVVFVRGRRGIEGVVVEYSKANDTASKIGWSKLHPNDRLNKFKAIEVAVKRDWKNGDVPPKSFRIALDKVLSEIGYRTVMS